MQLGFWQKTAIYVTASIVGFSGLMWFILHDVLAEDPGELAHVVLVLHGVSAYALLVVIGSLLPVHVRFGYLTLAISVGATLNPELPSLYRSGKDTTGACTERRRRIDCAGCFQKTFSYASHLHQRSS
jgi:hypothetical protein